MDNINEIQFTKMEGAGNDYIYINLFNQTIENPSKLAITMSDRHFGIGGDGIVLISPSDVADVKMNMFNADGSESEMCGNAIRCVGKYVHDHKLVEKSSMQVETGAGILELDVLFDQETQLVNQAKVSMGLPELNATKIPSTLTADSIVDHSFSFQSGETSFELKGTLVSMGNPHFITFVDSVENTLVHEWGK
ncbi:MAG: diaminopimelate epimerase, partial [bacterium]